MPWDADKSTAADPDNPAPDEQLTADEWDAHVTEGHFPSDELNFGVDAGGDPVITDPQNGGETVMRYDRATGSWVIDSLNTEEVSNIIIARNGDDLQDKLDEGGSDSLVLVGAGVFESNERFAPYPNQTVSGYSRDAVKLSVSGTTNAVNFNVNDAVGAVVEDLTVESPDATAGVIFSNRVETEIHNVRVTGGSASGPGIRCLEDRGLITNCRVGPVAGSEIEFGGNNGVCDENIVNGVVSIGGTNVVGTNVTY